MTLIQYLKNKLKNDPDTFHNYVYFIIKHYGPNKKGKVYDTYLAIYWGDI